jgi:two-component system, LytTR family, response regulator
LRPGREEFFFQEQPVSKDRLFITVQKKKVKILFAGVVYVESQKEYVKIVAEKNLLPKWAPTK